jgi:hypothetical protein
VLPLSFKHQCPAGVKHEQVRRLEPIPVDQNRVVGSKYDVARVEVAMRAVNVMGNCSTEARGPVSVTEAPIYDGIIERAIGVTATEQIPLCLSDVFCRTPTEEVWSIGQAELDERFTALPPHLFERICRLVPLLA